MPKSFKKFRDGWDSEWDDGDEDFRKKDDRLKDRRDQRRKKVNEKHYAIDEMDNE